MNAKPILIFSAVAAASMGAMGTAFVVEKRNATVKVAAPQELASVVVVPKPEEKLAMVEVPKPVELPKVTEIAKTPEAPKPEVPKTVEIAKVPDAPKPVELTPAEPKSVEIVEKTETPKAVEIAKIPVAPKVVEVPAPPVEPKVAIVVPAEKLPEPALEPKQIVEPVVEAPAAVDTLPAFDTVRVEAGGDAVIAGRADPGSDVTIKWNGKFVGKTTANADGSFVLVPEKPMKKGIGALTIEMSKDGKVIQSEGSVIVAVKENAPALVAKIDPIAPTTVTQVPATIDAAASGDVQLNAVDYDTAGNIVFSGRAEPGNIVRFYVDNVLTGEVSTSANGLWTFRGDERVSPGQHMLRADAVDTTGKVKSRIELPFLRETAEAVAAAKIIVPETIVEKTAAAKESQVAAVEKKRSITVETPVVDGGQAVTPEVAPKTDTQIAAATTTDVPAAETPVDTAEAIQLAPQKLVIQPGNNLWKLSRQIYGKGRMFTVIYEANRDQLRNPNRIYPGQILTAPKQN